MGRRSLSRRGFSCGQPAWRGQAAVFLFHLEETRKHGGHAQLRGFAAVDAGQQGIDQALHHLSPVVALYQ